MPGSARRRELEVPERRVHRRDPADLYDHAIQRHEEAYEETAALNFLNEMVELDDGIVELGGEGGAGLGLDPSGLPSSGLLPDDLPHAATPDGYSTSGLGPAGTANQSVPRATNQTQSLDEQLEDHAATTHELSPTPPVQSPPLRSPLDRPPSQPWSPEGGPSVAPRSPDEIHAESRGGPLAWYGWSLSMARSMAERAGLHGVSFDRRSQGLALAVLALLTVLVLLRPASHKGGRVYECYEAAPSTRLPQPRPEPISKPIGAWPKHANAGPAASTASQTAWGDDVPSLGKASYHRDSRDGAYAPPSSTRAVASSRPLPPPPSGLVAAHSAALPRYHPTGALTGIGMRRLPRVSKDEP